MPPPIRASEFDGDLSEFLYNYKYQQKLTRRLDDLEEVDLTPEILNEIVLWKVNRYVSLDGDQFGRIDALRNLKPGEHRQAHPVLAAFLDVHGVDLPMASTILRFRNPVVFRIIDRRAYRAIFGRGYPLYTASPAAKKITTYFHYVDELVKLCVQKKLAFETVDRILYQFDKEKNGTLKAQ